MSASICCQNSTGQKPLSPFLRMNLMQRTLLVKVRLYYCYNTTKHDILSKSAPKHLQNSKVGLLYDLLYNPFPRNVTCTCTVYTHLKICKQTSFRKRLTQAPKRIFMKNSKYFRSLKSLFKLTPNNIYKDCFKNGVQIISLTVTLRFKCFLNIKREL